MPLAEGGLSGLCFSALGAVVEKALRPMAEGALPEREAPDILSECHPLAAALCRTSRYLEVSSTKNIFLIST